MLRSEKEFSDRFPLLQDALAIRPQLLQLLGDNIGAFVQVEDADIVKRNMALHAHTWFSTKGLVAAYTTIARMQGLDAQVDEVYEVPCGSGNFVIVPPHEFQFPPGLPPNSGTFPQDPIIAIPGTSPPFPLPGDDIVDTFAGPVGPPDPTLWTVHTAGAGTAALNGAGQLAVIVPAAGDAAFVKLIDEYDRRAKFDTIVNLFTAPHPAQVDSDTAFALAILQPPPNGSIVPKPKADAILDRRVTVELDRPNGAIYIRVVTSFPFPNNEWFWDIANQRWGTAKVSAAPLAPLRVPYRITLRSHSQWFKIIIENTFPGPGFSLLTHTAPFFWDVVQNNGMPMSVVIGETSNDTATLPVGGVSFDRFETAQTEDCDYAKVSCLQVQFFIPAPPGAGTYFPPFGASLDADALAVILSNIRRKFEKVTPIHLRLKYPTQLLSAPVRFFQHFDVNDLAITSPLTAADLAANLNVDAAFTSADSHPADASPTMAFTKPPWVAGVGVADLYNEGQDGGWVQSEVVTPASTALHAVITDLGKRRLAELMGGFVSGPFAGGVNNAIRPIHFVVGTGGKAANGGARPPSSSRIDLEAAVTLRFLQPLVGPVGVGNDINVSLPPFSQEATIEFMLVLAAAANNIGPGQTISEVGVFVQFGGNPVELFLYGTFPPIASDGSTGIDLRLRVKI
jgi:hypothetical protein